MIASAQEKSFNQFGDAGLFCPGKLPPEGKRFLAQMQMDALNAHAHKLAFVGFQVKSRRDRETHKEKLKRYLSAGDWAGVKFGGSTAAPAVVRRALASNMKAVARGQRRGRRWRHAGRVRSPFPVPQTLRKGGGRQRPRGFGKNDECGFLPKAATPGRK